MAKVADVFRTLEYGPAPESSTLVRKWLDARRDGTKLFIGGQWVEPESGERFATHDPATGAVLLRLAAAGEADVNAAVAAAKAALPAWRDGPANDRARFLYAIARHLQKHARFFAVLESLDNGKPIRESRDIDIPLVARHFYHHAGWAQLVDNEFPEMESVGVVAQIIPWNFPLLMLAWKIAPALAAGNTVVLKPAEFTSLTALRFAELCADIGLPAGVVNVVTGDGRTGELLVRHPDVDKIAFTGSTDVGRLIRDATAGTGKKLSLELGGKSPFLVYEDTDLDGVVEGVVDAIWFNQGQVCCAGSRILVQEGIADRLIAKLKARMETLRAGDPLDKGIDIGAIVAPIQLERIRTLVSAGEAEGAEIWQPSWSVPKEGWFYPPTLCTNVGPASTIAQVEIFGPVVVLLTFRTPAESVALANNTRYGLAASLWTENINLALDIAPQLKAGTVWINCTNVFDAAAGFGGYRESGFGREGGKEGLFEYLRPRWEKRAAAAARAPETQPAVSVESRSEQRPAGAEVIVDRTAKLYIGGRQTRPDQGYSIAVHDREGAIMGEVGRGNRKDIRNAVEAAHRAASWANATAHLRAQILYFLAENMAIRRHEFAGRLNAMPGAHGALEVDAAIDRLFTWAAWADKYDGNVHPTPYRNVTLAMPEPIGVLGIVCTDHAPLLGFVSAFAPAIAMGNTTVVVPSELAPLAATDFYQVLDTSDVPAGVVNIVTGERSELGAVLAAHDDVDGLWHFATEGVKEAESLSAGNMKRTWCAHGRERDWFDAEQGQGREFLREATQVKNIWIPYGE
ncbi:MAG: aldehyde dehydrogenase family protein [Longimicrobiales bacterium]